MTSFLNTVKILGGRAILGVVIIVVPTVAIYQAYLAFGLSIALLGSFVVAGGSYLLWWTSGRPAMKSKYFPLYHIVIDPRSSPEFFATFFRDNQATRVTPEFLTYAPAGHRSKYGLQGHQIVGILLQHGGGLKPGNLSGNRAFKDKVHAIAAKEISESVRAKARVVGVGQIRLMDDRVQAEPEEAGDEHCIGIYTVADGEIVSYAPNVEFRLFSDRGLLELVESIRSSLYSEFSSGDRKAPATVG